MRAGELLHGWRTGRELTQKQAAELLGVSQASLSDYERGVKSPDVDRALRIAEITGGAVPVESWRKRPTGPDESGDDLPAIPTGTDPTS